MITFGDNKITCSFIDLTKSWDYNSYPYNHYYCGYIPEGYELVEKPEHKKKRLEDKVKELETSCSVIEDQVSVLLNTKNKYMQKIEEVKKELKDLE